jgi:hypothetical protein
MSSGKIIYAVIIKNLDMKNQIIKWKQKDIAFIQDIKRKDLWHTLCRLFINTECKSFVFIAKV